MKIVIDIPEDVYTRLFDNGIQDNEIAVDDVCEMARALRLGTLLPKEHGWIPVSERLPEEQGIYLAYIINEHDNKLQYPMTAYFSPNKVGCSPQWFPDDETASDNVIAWMPIPKPYEPQEISDRNLKMWEDIYAEEKRREGSD